MRYSAFVAFGLLALSFTVAPVIAAEVELSDGTKLSDKPYYIVTYVEAAPDATDAVATLLKQHAAASKDDEGNLGFEVLQRMDRKNHFAVLEIWADPDARNAHASSDETIKFRKDLQQYLYSPYDERTHVALFTQDPASLPMGIRSTSSLMSTSFRRSSSRPAPVRSMKTVLVAMPWFSRSSKRAASTTGLCASMRSLRPIVQTI